MPRYHATIKVTRNYWKQAELEVIVTAPSEADAEYLIRDQVYEGEYFDQIENLIANGDLDGDDENEVEVLVTKLHAPRASG